MSDARAVHHMDQLSAAMADIFMERFQIAVTVTIPEIINNGVFAIEIEGDLITKDMMNEVIAAAVARIGGKSCDN